MDVQSLIQQVLQSQGGELVQSLVSQLGFDPSVAEKFVPAAVDQLGQALSGGGGGGLDLGALVASVMGSGATDASSLIGQIDVSGLAQQVGTDEAQARQGLETLAPKLLDGLGAQAGGSADDLLSALGGGDAGGLLGAASKLFGK